MNLEGYCPERLAIDSIASRLTPRENGFRRYLIDYAICHNKPFNMKTDEPAEFNGWNAREMTESLIAKRAAAAADNGDVNFIYPLSVMPTAHQVHLQDGRTLFAMCAVDALGTSFTFDQNVRIRSKCAECSEIVSVSVENGCIAEVSPARLQVLHVDLKKFDNWAGSA
jgi:hypothetical protein